jgi:hypothetical protein
VAARLGPAASGARGRAGAPTVREKCRRLGWWPPPGRELPGAAALEQGWRLLGQEAGDCGGFGRKPS